MLRRKKFMPDRGLQRPIAYAFWLSLAFHAIRILDTVIRLLFGCDR